MTWATVIREGLEFLQALVLKLRGEPPAPRITKASVDKQVARQRELYRKNHPEK